MAGSGWRSPPHPAPAPFACAGASGVCPTVPSRISSTNGILNGMKTTIDKAGRVVIPASVRERAGLVAGTTLEITVDDLGVKLTPVAPGPRLVRVGKRLVARPTAAARPAVDVAALVEEERNRWP